MLSAIGLGDVVIPAISHATISTSPLRIMPTALWGMRPVRWVLIFGLVLSTTAALEFNSMSLSPDRAISSAERAAALWAADNTPPDAQFAVVTGDPTGVEGEQEWFPVLSGRASAATPQGAEWLGSKQWTLLYQANVDLQACATSTADCLKRWSRSHHTTLDYVFLPKGQLRGSASPPDCCVLLRDSLRQTEGVVVTYDGPGATIFRWVTDHPTAVRSEASSPWIPTLGRREWGAQLG
jgi:hypothetical protein